MIHNLLGVLPFWPSIAVLLLPVLLAIFKGDNCLRNVKRNFGKSTIIFGIFFHPGKKSRVDVSLARGTRDS